MSRGLASLVALTVFALFLSPAHAEKRLALIIVNQDYTSLQRLSAPPKDGELIQKALEGANFEVVLKKDQTGPQMWDAIFDFTHRLSEAAKEGSVKPVGFFYYSGHGASDGSDNYLVPVGVSIADADQLAVRGIGESKVLSEFSKISNDNNFLVFDACREVPFVRTTKGFAPVPKEDLRRGGLHNVLVAHSAYSGDVTLDDTLYSSALSSEISKIPSDAAIYIFKKARKTYGEQSGRNPGEIAEMRDSVPSYDDEFFFHPRVTAVSRQTSTPVAPPEVGPAVQPSLDQWTIKKSWDKKALFFTHTSPYYRTPNPDTDPLGEIPAGTEVADKLELGWNGRGAWYKFVNLFGQVVYSSADGAETVGAD
jgi:hypothetical protein